MAPAVQPASGPLAPAFPSHSHLWGWAHATPSAALGVDGAQAEQPHPDADPDPEPEPELRAEARLQEAVMDARGALARERNAAGKQRARSLLRQLSPAEAQLADAEERLRESKAQAPVAQPLAAPRPTVQQAAGRARAAVWRLAENDIEGTRARQDPRWRRVATLAVAAATAAAEAPPLEPGDDGTLPEDLTMWRQQYATMAAEGNLEFGELALASSLPTVLKLLGVPSLRVKAITVLHTIAASTVRTQIRELEEQSVILARTLGSLLASSDDSAVRCGAMGVAAVAQYDAIRASLFHAGQVDKIVQLSAVAQPPLATGGLPDWHREEQKEVAAQQTCREATLRLKAARARAQQQFRVAVAAEKALDERTVEMDAALEDAARQEKEAFEANVKADTELAEAVAAEEHAKREVEKARAMLEKAKLEEAEAAAAQEAAAKQAAEAAEVNAGAEVAEATAVKEEAAAEEVLKAQQAAEQELAEAQKVLVEGLVTEGERAGEKMKKDEKLAAEAELVAKQEQLATAPAWRVDAAAEQADVAAASAALENPDIKKKERAKLEGVVAAKEAALQAARSAGVTKARDQVVAARGVAVQKREEAEKLKQEADDAQAAAEKEAAEAVVARQEADTELAEADAALAAAVEDRQQAEEAKADAVKQQEEADEARAVGNTAHAAYKAADLLARNERTDATRLHHVAEVERGSENLAAHGLQRASEPPQSWGLSRELRKESIALRERVDKLEEDGFCYQEEQQRRKQHMRRAQHVEVPAAATEGQCQKIAEDLATIVIRQRQRTPQNGSPTTVAEPPAAMMDAGAEIRNEEADEDGLSDEDRALQTEQLIQFAMDGNIDFDDLAQVSSLPTLLKFVRIPQLSKQACGVLQKIAVATAAEDSGTVRQLAAPGLCLALGEALDLADRSAAGGAIGAIAALARHGAVRSALFETGVIGCERLVANPELCVQVCETIRTIAAIDDSEAVQMLAAPALIATLTGLLESGKGVGVCSAAGAIAVLVRHDSIRAALFESQAIAKIQGLLLSKPTVATPTVMIVHAVLSKIVDAAVLRAMGADETKAGSHHPVTIVCTNTRDVGVVLASLCHAAGAVIGAEMAPERRAATVGWFVARPRSGHAGRRGRLKVGEAEVAHRLEVLDSIARSFEQGQQPRKRYGARAVTARKVRHRERNWCGDRVRQEPTTGESTAGRS